MKVLIVDDSAVMRKIVERTLRQAGVQLEECLFAGDGAEALTHLREAQDRLDLVLCDIVMPGMSGLDFLEQRAKEQLAPHVPIVMVTTDCSSASVLRALAAGAKGYICKPFTTDQVKLRVLPVLAAADALRSVAS
jgi:two-component system chemotaxis response regulator CheY